MTDERLICCEESGIRFGYFLPEDYYGIEKSEEVYVSRAEQIPAVEFVLVRDTGKGSRLIFVEAKKSAPRKTSTEDLRSELEALVNSVSETERPNALRLINSISVRSSYIEDICDKFCASWGLLTNIAFRGGPSHKVPEKIVKLTRQTELRVVFLLVIADAKEDWLAPISSVLEKEMKRRLRGDWKFVNFSAKALTPALAREKKLVVACC